MLLEGFRALWAFRAECERGFGKSCPGMLSESGTSVICFRRFMFVKLAKEEDSQEIHEMLSFMILIALAEPREPLRLTKPH